MPLNLFYTMVQKSQKWPKTQIKGGSCLKTEIYIVVKALLQGRHTRSGRSGPDPTNFFRLFFFLSFEANGFARSLKLNGIEHYKLDESKGRCPRETFFGSRFSPAFPHARRSTRVSATIFHVTYCQCFTSFIYWVHTKRIPDPNIFLRMLLYVRCVTPKLLA